MFQPFERRRLEAPTHHGGWGAALPDVVIHTSQPSWVLVARIMPTGIIRDTADRGGLPPTYVPGHWSGKAPAGQSRAQGGFPF